MTSVFIDGEPWTESVLEPRQFLCIEYDIVAVGLCVVIGVTAQGVADDVEAIVGDQGCGGRVRPLLQIVGRENLREIFRERLQAQYALGLLERIADSRRMFRIDDAPGAGVKVACV